uniref:Rho GTPase-activating protein 19 n=1 Tax=Petromyzon marinus TaxID=7757 RepID=A0AAJ7SYZ4_PETMA|nr:rho GTPase-activating protein 19-like isoform X2 [Petromyzon marinus]
MPLLAPQPTNQGRGWALGDVTRARDLKWGGGGRKKIMDATERRPLLRSNIVISNEVSAGGSRPSGHVVVSNPDFFVEKLRHEWPERFQEMVVSGVTRHVDLPGTELAQLMGEMDPRLPGSTATAFLRSLPFLRKKVEKGAVFGAPLTEEGIARIYQLIEYLHKNLHVEGLFRVSGSSLRQQALRDLLNSGREVDLDNAMFHPQDVASVLKAFLGELPEPLLTHRHYNAHLKINELTLFDTKGNKTSVVDKERQLEALQLLFLLLPPANRNLLRLLLDLLHQTARRQDTNKMSAFNLALMFSPHILWPRNVTANDLQENIGKMNNAVAFMIKHSQKLFKAPAYIRKQAMIFFPDASYLETKGAVFGARMQDQMEAAAVEDEPPVGPKRGRLVSSSLEPTENVQRRTDEAIRDLFRHVQNMPDSAKKKKVIKQFNKYSNVSTPVTENQARSKRSTRSRSFSGLIRRRVLGVQFGMDKNSGGSGGTVTPGSELSRRVPYSGDITPGHTPTPPSSATAQPCTVAALRGRPKRRSRSTDAIHEARQSAPEVLNLLNSPLMESYI